MNQQSTCLQSDIETLIRSGPPTVLLDANVLVPQYLRAVLLELAEARLFRPHWSKHILEEVRRNLAGLAEQVSAADRAHRSLAGAHADKLPRCHGHRLRALGDILCRLDGSQGPARGSGRPASQQKRTRPNSGSPCHAEHALPSAARVHWNSGARYAAGRLPASNARHTASDLSRNAVSALQAPTPSSDEARDIARGVGERRLRKHCTVRGQALETGPARASTRRLIHEALPPPHQSRARRCDAVGSTSAEFP